MSAGKSQNVALVSAPNPKQIDLAPDGDVFIEHTSGHKFLVDSRTLSRCSPVFEAMFRWKEGQNLSAAKPTKIKSEVNFQGLELLLRVMHNKVDTPTSDIMKVEDIVTYLVIATDYYNCMPVVTILLESLIRLITINEMRGSSNRISPRNQTSFVIVAFFMRDQELLTGTTAQIAQSCHHKEIRSAIRASEHLVPSEFWYDLSNALQRMRNSFLRGLVDLDLGERRLQQIEQSVNSKQNTVPIYTLPGPSMAKGHIIARILRSSLSIKVWIDLLKSNVDSMSGNSGVDDVTIRQFLNAEKWLDWGLCLGCLKGPIGYKHVCL